MKYITTVRRNTIRFFTFFVALLLLLLPVLTACGTQTAEKFLDEELDRKAHAMTDALLAGDEQGVYTMVSSIVDDKQSFHTVYLDLRSLVEGCETYTLTVLGAHVNVKYGSEKYTEHTAVYKLQLDDGRTYQLSVAQRSDIQGLITYHIGELTTQTGSLTTMNGASPAQWAMLAFWGVEIAFAIWMLVDCCRHKMKNKVLMIFVILLGFFTLSVTGGAQTGFHLRFLSVLQPTCFIIAGDTWVLHLSLPVGAIIYALIRKKLFAEWERRQAAQATPEVPEAVWVIGQQPDAEIKPVDETANEQGSNADTPSAEMQNDAQDQQK